jgi:hypothetical protein
MAPSKMNPVTHAAWKTEAIRLLTYDPATGTFTWNFDRVRPLVGAEAGSIKPSGYRVIVVGGRMIRAHRLAWLFMTGDLPPDGTDVDHRDGVRANNQWENLRLATRALNIANSKSKGNSRYRGVTFDKSRGKWMASAGPAGTRRNLGRFDNEQDAARAYDIAATRIYGDFAKLNFPEGKIA